MKRFMKIWKELRQDLRWLETVSKQLKAKDIRLSKRAVLNYDARSKHGLQTMSE